MAPRIGACGAKEVKLTITRESVRRRVRVWNFHSTGFEKVFRDMRGVRRFRSVERDDSRGEREESRREGDVYGREH